MNFSLIFKDKKIIEIVRIKNECNRDVQITNYLFN